MFAHVRMPRDVAKRGGVTLLGLCFHADSYLFTPRPSWPAVCTIGNAQRISISEYGCGARLEVAPDRYRVHRTERRNTVSLLCLWRAMRPQESPSTRSCGSGASDNTEAVAWKIMREIVRHLHRAVGQLAETWGEESEPPPLAVRALPQDMEQDGGVQLAAVQQQPPSGSSGAFDEHPVTQPPQPFPTQVPAVATGTTATTSVQTQDAETQCGAPRPLWNEPVITLWASNIGKCISTREVGNRNRQLAEVWRRTNELQFMEVYRRWSAHGRTFPEIAGLRSGEGRAGLEPESPPEASPPLVGASIITDRENGRTPPLVAASSGVSAPPPSSSHNAHQHHHTARAPFDPFAHIQTQEDLRKFKQTADRSMMTKLNTTKGVVAEEKLARKLEDMFNCPVTCRQASVVWNGSTDTTAPRLGYRPRPPGELADPGEFRVVGALDGWMRIPSHTADDGTIVPEEDVVVELKHRMSNVGPMPDVDKYQIQMYLHMHRVQRAVYAQGQFTKEDVKVEFVERDDALWSAVILPGIRTFVCDIRRLIRGDASDLTLRHGVFLAWEPEPQELRPFPAMDGTTAGGRVPTGTAPDPLIHPHRPVRGTAAGGDTFLLGPGHGSGSGEGVVHAHPASIMVAFRHDRRGELLYPATTGGTGTSGASNPRPRRPVPPSSPPPLQPPLCPLPQPQMLGGGPRRFITEDGGDSTATTKKAHGSRSPTRVVSTSGGRWGIETRDDLPEPSRFTPMLRPSGPPRVPLPLPLPAHQQALLPRLRFPGSGAEKETSQSRGAVSSSTGRPPQPSGSLPVTVHACRSLDLLGCVTLPSNGGGRHVAGRRQQTDADACDGGPPVPVSPPAPVRPASRHSRIVFSESSDAAVPSSGASSSVSSPVVVQPSGVRAKRAGKRKMRSSSEDSFSPGPSETSESSLGGTNVEDVPEPESPKPRAPPTPQPQHQMLFHIIDDGRVTSSRNGSRVSRRSSTHVENVEITSTSRVRGPPLPDLVALGAAPARQESSSATGTLRHGRQETGNSSSTPSSASTVVARVPAPRHGGEAQPADESPTWEPPPSMMTKTATILARQAKLARDRAKSPAARMRAAQPEPERALKLAPPPPLDPHVQPSHHSPHKRLRPQSVRSASLDAKRTTTELHLPPSLLSCAPYNTRSRKQ